MCQCLEEKLLDYSKTDYYPFHMPGHKRQKLGDFLPEEIDITEIDGFDNLHHAEGVLREGQERLARLFGADESCYLVNGSTVGLLAAICGCIHRGDRILIGRNCHKAVYHAAYLMEAKLEYLYPEPTVFGIQGSIAPEQAEDKLEKFSDVRAVVITSPTYDGIVSDIRAIAEIVHRHGIPLIVDEAHGAHFGFSEGFPQKAIARGADLCVESLHKTLPSYTQTAVLHMMRQRRGSGFGDNLVTVKNGKASFSPARRGNVRDTEKNEKRSKSPPEFWFDPARVKRFLGIFQSSSPSYVLMAGMDRCVRMVEEDVRLYVKEETRQESRFRQFEERLRRFYGECEKLHFVEVFPFVSSFDTAVQNEERGKSEYIPENRELSEAANPGTGFEQSRKKNVMTGFFTKDNSKILISAECAGLHGQQLYDLLLQKYHLQMEMASGHYVTALTSIMDTEEGFRRLYDALREIDEAAANQRFSNGRGIETEKDSGRLTPLTLYTPRKKVMEPAKAIDEEKESILLEESEGRISGDFVWLYPPGIPILVPGEVITGDVLELLAICRARHMQVQGMQDMSGERIQVVTIV